MESGAADFNVILVHGINRRGRFQDSDESAHYAYICKRAGINLAYCAEQYKNDGSPSLPSSKASNVPGWGNMIDQRIFRNQKRIALNLCLRWMHPEFTVQDGSIDWGG
ncbi:hypothetical protein [Sulfitobacter sp. F26204]|uniref:hypothetical protein n=1 Tax=Sulfitobacter sp. F26204 TaxID=2996014 RepID=UPI00225DF703|nr:hypothetical protein [Sulfitobacter sp. F26204]